MDEKEIAKIYDYGRLDISQKVMVQTQDGQIQEQVIPRFTMVLKCPSCQSVIFDFGQDIPEAYVRRIVNAHKPEFERIAYCSCCGQKLGYDFDVIESDSEVKVVE